ncbi:hypothetical protein D3C76_1838860 [compost metagenome]
MFHFRTHLRLGLLDLASHPVQHMALTVFLVGAATCRYLPDDRPAFVLFALLHAGIAGIGTDHVLLAVQ